MNLTVEQMENEVNEYREYAATKNMFEGLMFYLTAKEERELMWMYESGSVSESSFYDKLCEMMLKAEGRKTGKVVDFKTN